jgi:heat shock protein HslJ
LIARVLGLLILATALPGCGTSDVSQGSQGGEAISSPVESGHSGAAHRPGLDDAAGATYHGIYDHPVTLSGGIFEGAPFADGGVSAPRVELLQDFEFGADINGDGREETIVLLSESSGGSGTFSYLATLTMGDGRVINIGTAPLGDRIQIQSWRVADGFIELDMVQSGPEDAACCPSQLVTRRWTQTDRDLTEGPTEIRGKLSPAVLAAAEWRLVAMDLDEKAPAEPPVTIVFREDKAAGSSGCNRYMGNTMEGRMPGELTIGPLAGTMMACPEDMMKIEQRYLVLLSQVTRFSFHLGKLALTSVDEGGDVHVLLFEDSKAAP